MDQQQRISTVAFVAEATSNQLIVDENQTEIIENGNNEDNASARDSGSVRKLRLSVRISEDVEYSHYEDNVEEVDEEEHYHKIKHLHGKHRKSRYEHLPKPTVTISHLKFPRFSDIRDEESEKEPSSIDSESSSESEKSKKNFLEEFGKVPSLSQITLDKVEEKPISRYFVNPLTGRETDEQMSTVDKSKESEDEGETKDEKRANVISKKTDTRSIDFEEEFDEDYFDKFDDLYEEQKEVIEAIEEDRLFDIATFTIPKKAVKKEKIEIKKVELEEPELELAVGEFLKDLISEILNYVRGEERLSILRCNLNKFELLRHVGKFFNELCVERSANHFLNRKAMEYFRRRGVYRNITPEVSESTFSEYDKYAAATTKLDRILATEACMKKNIKSRIKNLEDEKKELEQTVEKEFREFEHMLEATFKRDGMPNLEEFVKRDLRKMRALSKELREVRLGLIGKNHDLGTLQAQLTTLEDIGNGLSVADYEIIQSQTVAVYKKVEDRSRDLNKQLDCFHNSLHILAHLKLRNEMHGNGMTALVLHSEALERTKTIRRMEAFELKKERQTIKRQLSDLSLQSGLIDKPILLQDYDETLEKVEKKRKIIEDLRQTQRKLEQKLMQSEKLCKIK